MEHSEMFPNKFIMNIFQSSKFFLNISDNYPEHCELFSNIFHFTLWNVYSFFECSGTFWKVLKEIFLNVSKQIIREHFKKFKLFSEYFWQLSRTLWVALKHFSLHTLKCLQTSLETFWMFKNILKSSKGTFKNVSK